MKNSTSVKTSYLSEVVVMNKTWLQISLANRQVEESLGSTCITHLVVIKAKPIRVFSDNKRVFDF